MCTPVGTTVHNDLGCYRVFRGSDRVFLKRGFRFGVRTKRATMRPRVCVRLIGMVGSVLILSRAIKPTMRPDGLDVHNNCLMTLMSYFLISSSFEKVDFL